MTNDTKELEFIDKNNFNESYIVQLNQKITVLTLKIRDRVEPSDDDYDLLRALHKFHYNGEYLIYKSKVNLTDEKATQQGLFSEAPTPPIAKDPIHDDLAQ